MGIMDSAKNALGLNEEEAQAKGTGMADKTKNQAKEAVTKAGDAVDQKTGGKFASHVDKGQDKANEAIDRRTQGR